MGSPEAEHGGGGDSKHKGPETGMDLACLGKGGQCGWSLEIKVGLGVVLHTCNSSYSETEAEGL
jgi:hypothetical protein